MRLLGPTVPNFKHRSRDFQTDPRRFGLRFPLRCQGGIRTHNRRTTMIRTTLLALTASTALVGAAYAQTMDIVDTAVANGSFTTLVAAVQAAGLVDVLKGEGPFTVFAPTDAAFAALPAGTVEALLNDIPTLTGILTYHVIPGAVMASDLSEGLTAATVNGAEVTFTLANGAQINGANIVMTDVQASNGVIHVIDAVILPPAN